MIPTCCTLGRHLPAFSLQASNDQRVRQHPETGEDSLVPPFITDIARAVSDLLSRILPPQQDADLPRRRNASQPLLREPEAATSAYGSVDRQINAAAGVAPQALVPPSGAQAPALANKPAAQGSGKTSADKAASAAAYRRELEAWVASGTLSTWFSDRKAQSRINDYLKSPERHKWTLDLSGLAISTLPPLPADLKALNASFTKLKALPENLPTYLQYLKAGHTSLSALPQHLPKYLLYLDIEMCCGLTALPEHLPKYLQYLKARYTSLIALPEHLPESLRYLDLETCWGLTTLPENLPDYLQYLSLEACTNLSALPMYLPKCLQYLNANYTGATLPKNLPKFLHTICVDHTKQTPEELLAVVQANTFITTLEHHYYFLRTEIREALENNKKARRLPYAAASLDLLTRLAFTTDQTGTLINRASTPNPVLDQLPEASILAELHDVLAAHCPPDVLTVLAKMAGDSQ